MWGDGNTDAPYVPLNTNRGRPRNVRRRLDAPMRTRPNVNVMRGDRGNTPRNLPGLKRRAPRAE